MAWVIECIEDGCAKERIGRSDRCADCRHEHRRARQTEAQQRRRAARKPIVISRDDAKRIVIAADLAEDASDALADWLTFARPRRRALTVDATTRAGGLVASAPVVDGGDLARATVDAMQDLVRELHALRAQVQDWLGQSGHAVAR